MMDTKLKNRVKSYLPELVNQVHPVAILPYLPCLSDMEQEEITTSQSAMGGSKQSAMMTLYSHIVRKMKGFEELVNGLRELGHDHLADDLEANQENDPRNTSRKTVPRFSHTRQSAQNRKKPVDHSTLVTDLNAGAFQILEMLGYSGTQGWKELASHLDYSISDCYKIENDSTVTKDTPTAILIKNCTDLTLGKLLHILKNEMERMDVAESLEKLTGYKLPVVPNGIDQSDGDHRDRILTSDSKSASVEGRPEASGVNQNAISTPTNIIYRREGNDRHTNIEEINTHIKESNGVTNGTVKPSVTPGPEEQSKQLPATKGPVRGYNTTDYNPYLLPKPVIRVPQKLNTEKEENIITKLISTKTGEMLVPQPRYLDNNHITELSQDTSNLYAQEELDAHVDTKLEGVNMIPMEGAQPKLIKQVRFCRQESEQPGPYVPTAGGSPASVYSPAKPGPYAPMTGTNPVEPGTYNPATGGSPASVLSLDKPDPNTLTDSLDTAADRSDVPLPVPAPSLPDPMYISVGYAHSIHHFNTNQSSGDDVSKESMLSSNEETADIQRKARKPFPNAIGADVSDIDDNGQMGNFISNISDTDSYEISNSVLYFDSSETCQANQGLQLGCDLFNRRMNMKEVLEDDPSRENTTPNILEPPAALFEDNHEMETGNCNSLSTQTSDKSVEYLGKGRSIDSSMEGSTNDLVDGHNPESSDDSLGTLNARGLIRGELTEQDSANQGDNVDEATHGDSFRWMMVFAGTAAAASLIYNSLK